MTTRSLASAPSCSTVLGVKRTSRLVELCDMRTFRRFKIGQNKSSSLAGGRTMLAIAPKESRPNQDVCEPKKISAGGWGGRRPGAGRPKGSKNKLLTLVSNRPADISPIDFMLSIMRDENQSMKLRLRVAANLLPYCHPKLKSIIVGSQPHLEPNIFLVSWRE